MTINDVLKLLDAGYTRDEISAMSEADPEPEANPEPEKQEPEKSEPEKKEPEKDLLKMISGEFEKINKANQEALQKMFILASEQPAENKPDASEVLANVLDPKEK